jgi:hypothetical protein
MYRNIRGIDLGLSLTVFEYRIVGNALPKLNLNVSLRQVGNVGLGIASQAENIGIVQLHFGSRIVTRRKLVTADNRGIQCRCRPITRVSALSRHVAMNHADARHPLISLRRLLAGRRCGLIGPLRLSDLKGRIGLLRRPRPVLRGLGLRTQTQSTGHRQSQNCQICHQSVFHGSPLPIPRAT